MARVYSLQEIELRPGVDPAEFVRMFGRRSRHHPRFRV